MTIHMSKSVAISTVKKHLGISLQDRSTHFANLNSSKSVWWFDISEKKITSGTHYELDILVFHSKTKELHHLRVPTSYVKDNIKKFHIRQDKKTVSLEMSSASTNQFQDVRPTSGKMHFAQFLRATITL